MHYFLSVWWLHLLDGLGHYFIQPRAIGQLLVMTNNLTTFGYTYTKLRINSPPNIVYKLTHLVWIVT